MLETYEWIGRGETYEYDRRLGIVTLRLRDRPVRLHHVIDVEEQHEGDPYGYVLQISEDPPAMRANTDL